jgi:phage-related tail protein
MDAFSDAYSRGELEGRGSLDLLNALAFAQEALEAAQAALAECKSVTVGEKGPELVNFHGGEIVVPNEKPKEADA